VYIIGHVRKHRGANRAGGLILACEGLGDCLFALAVIRKMKAEARGR